jgi:anti-anti-sigma regulatory factor
VFFSAPHFKRAVARVVADAGPDIKWVVIDLLPVSMIDATGLFSMRDAFDSLRARGLVVAAAGRDTEWEDRAARRDLSGVLSGIRFFPTLRLAEATYLAETGNDAVAGSRPKTPAPAATED